LQDDYVRFIRFAQWKISQAGEGVLGFITNHSYLDNPTFRGMRQSLMDSFNEIYILDLHGNSLKKEKCPDGSKDDERLIERYEKYPKVADIFPLNGVGMTTARDSFVIDRDKNTLLNRIRLFKNSKYSDDDLHAFFQINRKKGWNIRKAWNMLQSISDSDLNKFVLPVLYRPFDVQWIFYHDSVVWRTVKRVMHHMMQENLALCIGRAGQVVGLEKPWNIVFCSDCIEDFNLFYRGGNVNFPLYIYPNTDNSPNHVRGTNRTMMMIFEPAEAYRPKKPNINQAFIDFLTKTYAKMAKQEKIFYYIYAVLYSNIYRIKYAEFLKIDFPRVPFTKDYEIFSKMGEYGKRLVGLHLLKSVEIDQPIAKFQGKGGERVEKLRYDEKEKRTYINESQYFEGITEEVWQYQIGGYQVCNKWLKDRKKKLLSLDDIKHYCKIVTSLQKTIEVQKAIDDIYPEVEKETVEIENR